MRMLSDDTVSSMDQSPAAPTLPRLLLPALREETRDLHERIESRLDLTAHFASPFHYRRLLERFYGFYAPLEERLAEAQLQAAWDMLAIDSRDRRKAASLKSDLQFLGVPEEDLTALPRCPAEHLPVLDSTAALTGCAYVVEGATLGGQIIGRLLEQALGLHPGEPGARFFHGYGAKNGAMWQQFCRAAESLAAREASRGSGHLAYFLPQAVAAARATFAGMEHWLLADDRQQYAPFLRK